jgi:multiple sugar transport system permease protein
MATTSTTHSPAVTRWYVKPSLVISILLTIMVGIVAVLWLYPLVCVVGLTFNRLDALMPALTFLPKTFTLEVYRRLVTDYHLERYVLNTLNVAFGSAILTVFSATLAGYAVGKMRFKGRELIFYFILATMLLPAQATLAPTFVLYRKLHLLDTHLGLILPSLGGGAYNIFLMRQFMLRLPDEIMDAGRIDGCNEFGLFWRLVLPNMLGPVMVLATLAVNGAWTQLIGPQIFIFDLSKQLIMPAILSINTAGVADPYAYVATIAAATLCTLLPVALYSYSQRHFMSALAGAIKG